MKTFATILTFALTLTFAASAVAQDRSDYLNSLRETGDRIGLKPIGVVEADEDGFIGLKPIGYVGSDGSFVGLKPIGTEEAQPYMDFDFAAEPDELDLDGMMAAPDWDELKPIGVIEMDDDGFVGLKPIGIVETDDNGLVGLKPIGLDYLDEDGQIGL